MSHNFDPLHIIKCGTNNEGDTRDEYMKKLHKWCAEATQHNMQTLALYQHYYMQLQHNFQTSNPNGNAPTATPIDPVINRATYYIYRVPPMWKRFVAEFIDFLILFVVKMFLTILLIENFELLDFDTYSLSAFEAQLQNPTVATKLTIEIFTLELLHRTIVCFYEAYWLALESATPGKKIMGLAVVHAVSVIQPTAELDRVLAYPCTVLTFKDAFLRAVLKNIFVGILFPICFVLLFFKHNRTGYDLLTNSLVVEQGTNLPRIE